MPALLSSIERTALMAFVVAFSILLAVSTTTILFLRQTRLDDGWVDHTHYVIENLQACLLAEREMEVSVRTYVLRGARSDLQTYQDGIDQFAKSLEAVQGLTADNERQQRRILTLLRPLVNERLTLAARVIETRQRDGREAAEPILFQSYAVVLARNIRNVIYQMQSDERVLLQVRIEKHQRSSHRLLAMILLGFVLASGFLVGASLLIHADMQERQRMTEELQAMNKELEAFSYSVSHDLRAPLRGIEGFSQVIVENYKDRLDEIGQGYFNRISLATKRMGNLIDEILNLSRITRSPLQAQEVDLAVLAHAIADDLQKREPARRVTWTIPNSLPVRGDPTLLHVVLTNLLSNAWKFTGPRTAATITLDKMIKDNRLVYYVRDNGAGFDATYQNKLFQAFQRLHTTAEFPGIGIGLATVQRIVRRHGGRIWAEGAVDRGATFYFTLG